MDAQVDVATEYGMSKQRVSGAVATIERAYKKTTTPGVSSIRVGAGSSLKPWP
jgi:hypothetical protein